MTAPVFTHDCPSCVFLGHVDGCDHYICPSGSLIARDGHDGADYTSMNRRFVADVLAHSPDYILGLTAALAARRGL